jgi:hypothetical protein
MATQTFPEHGRCIFEGKRVKPNEANDNQEDISGGWHVVRTRSWWKRGEVDACAAQTNMQCWVHQDTIFDGEQAETNMCDSQEKTGRGMDRCIKCVMGAGSVCLQRPGCNLVVRVGREEEGVSSLRPELAAIARTLHAAPAESDLLYLCDSEAALNKMSRWIGSGPRTTLAGDANADIMTSINQGKQGDTLC